MVHGRIGEVQNLGHPLSTAGKVVKETVRSERPPIPRKASSGYNNVLSFPGDSRSLPAILDLQNTTRNTAWSQSEENCDSFLVSSVSSEQAARRSNDAVRKTTSETKGCSLVDGLLPAQPDGGSRCIFHLFPRYSDVMSALRFPGKLLCPGRGGEDKHPATQTRPVQLNKTPFSGYTAALPKPAPSKPIQHKYWRRIKYKFQAG